MNCYCEASKLRLRDWLAETLRDALEKVGKVWQRAARALRPGT